MFDRFASPAREALVGAQQIAIEAGAGEIGSEHLLASLLKVPDGRAREVLEALGIDPAEALREVTASIGSAPPPRRERRRGSRPRTATVPFDKSSKSALEGALREAVRLNHDDINGPHLLLGLLRPESGSAHAILSGLGVSLAAARDAVAPARRPTGQPFRQVNVFSAAPLGGNPVAVVHDADELSDEQMAAFARWTNLSETTFLLSPTDPAADYRLRIFTPGGELPFAGHPTLGSAHAWLEAGGVPRGEQLVQECGVGPVRLRRTDRLAFAAPPLIRSGPVDDAELDRICAGLRIDRAAIVEGQWIDNGAGWVAVLLENAAAVLALEPDYGAFDGLDVGVAGLHPPEGDVQIEVRGFAPTMGIPEDPVTGSLNAGLAQWLIANGTLPPSYVAAQGTAIGRDGRAYIDTDGDGTIWIGGDTLTTISGTVDFDLRA